MLPQPILNRTHFTTPSFLRGLVNGTAHLPQSTYPAALIVDSSITEDLTRTMTASERYEVTAIVL